MARIAPKTPVQVMAEWLHSEFCPYRHYENGCGWDYDAAWDHGAHAFWVLRALKTVQAWEDAVTENNARVG